MLTYEDLASVPARVDIPKTNYSHVAQSGTQNNSSPTFGGTRTYDHSGQPSDSDQD